MPAGSRLVVVGLIVVALAFAATGAAAADRIRLAVQRTGTLAWELDVIKTHGLDRKADLDIEPSSWPRTEAGKIALKGGSADLMLSDWLWVARERSLGDSLVFYPSSSTLGAVMVPAHSPIRNIADLKGSKLAVAGGPIDKSWLLLQALARRAGVDLKKAGDDRLRRAAAAVGEGAAGRDRRHADVLELLRRAREQGAQARHRDGRRSCRPRRQRAGRDRRLHLRRAPGPRATDRRVDRFLDAARQAKEILAGSEAEWQRLAPRIGVTDAERARDLSPALCRRHPAPAARRRGGRRARAYTACWPRSAAPSSSARRASSTPARSTAPAAE